MVTTVALSAWQRSEPRQVGRGQRRAGYRRPVRGQRSRN